MIVYYIPLLLYRYSKGAHFYFERLIADMAVRLRVVGHGDGADPGDPLLPGFQEKDRVSEADRERPQGPRAGRQAFDPGQKRQRQEEFRTSQRRHQEQGDDAGSHL